MPFGSVSTAVKVTDCPTVIDVTLVPKSRNMGGPLLVPELLAVPVVVVRVGVAEAPPVREPPPMREPPPVLLEVWPVELVALPPPEPSEVTHWPALQARPVLQV